MDVGGTYVEYGAIAIDNKDGDISGRVVTSGTVNTSKAGRYTITYTVSDATGNKAQVTRLVVVQETKKGCDACLCMQKFDDSEPPVIVLLGDNPAKIYKGTTYKEQGYTAYDNEDGDLTDKVEVTVTDNYITYTVTDSSGNTATVTREIDYIDKQTIVKAKKITATTPIEVCVGKTDKISYKTSNISNPKIKYSIKSGSDKISLSSNKVKGLKTGTAYVTIKETSKGVQSTAKITVKTCTAADPNLKAFYEVVYIPKGTTFVANATPDSNTQVCSASNGFKVDVDNNYSTSKVGDGTITCTSEGRSKTIKVIVFDITASDVRVTVGETKSGLKGTVSPSSVASLGTISYKSNNTSIATVSGDKVTGVKVGKTERTVTFTLDKSKVKNALIVKNTATATPNITVDAKNVTTTRKPSGGGTTTSTTTTTTKACKEEVIMQSTYDQCDKRCNEEGEGIPCKWDEKTRTCSKICSGTVGVNKVNCIYQSFTACNAVASKNGSTCVLKYVDKCYVAQGITTTKYCATIKLATSNNGVFYECGISISDKGEDFVRKYANYTSSRKCFLTVTNVTPITEANDPCKCSGRKISNYETTILNICK